MEQQSRTWTRPRRWALLWEPQTPSGAGRAYVTHFPRVVILALGACSSATRGARSALTWARTHLGPATCGHPEARAGTLLGVGTAGCVVNPGADTGSAALGRGWSRRLRRGGRKPGGSGLESRSRTPPPEEGLGCATRRWPGRTRTPERSPCLAPHLPSWTKAQGCWDTCGVRRGEGGWGWGETPPRALPNDLPPTLLAPWSPHSRRAHSTTRRWSDHQEDWSVLNLDWALQGSRLEV